VFRARLWLAAALPLVTAACGTTTDQVVGRYASVNCTDSTGTTDCTARYPSASASAVSIVTQASPPAAASASVPPDRALAACVAAFGDEKMAAASKDYCAALVGKPAPAPVTSIDRTVYHRTLIVTVRKEPPFNPADRLEATDVTISTDNARFDNWDTVATAYTTINAGTAQLTQARGATENLSLGAPSTFPFAASGTFGGSQTDTRVENLTASAQLESLTATIDCDGHCLKIRRQGGYGVDLAGNTVIKVDMTYCPAQGGGECASPESTTVFAVTSYKKPATDTIKKPGWLAPGDLEITSKQVSIPPSKYGRSGIKAKVGLTYTLRHVFGGDPTYEEADDKVQEITVTPSDSTVVLIPGRDAAPPMFGLHRYSDQNALKFVRPGKNPTGACFDTYGEAEDFLAYLRIIHGDPSHVGGMTLEFRKISGDHILTRPALKDMYVDVGCD
jgi:hypothetical protein